MFNQWMNKTLEDRGWSARELARRAGISHTYISNIASGKRLPTWDFCAAIAGPLGMSPIVVFQKAGLIRQGNLKNEYYGKTLTDDEVNLVELYRRLGDMGQYYALATLAGIRDFAEGAQDDNEV